ncbi:pancreatic triacylglycerol lipase-like [Anastrepha ludens]|uniref:pancreatic triacylglycerol lipase-like n=1 Tax=Anastrepha ludens TaxID=28586 RepID=UPI0023AED150|nr:pancreatic triacylglycerol lipase-like [Anastrepha ludens]
METSLHGKMRVILLLLALNLLSVFALDTAQVEHNEEDYGKTWMWMPDGDGNPQIAYLVEPPEDSQQDDMPEFVNVELFDRANSDATTTVQISVANDDNRQGAGAHIRQKRDTWEEMAEKFNADLDTKILVHGWKSSTTSDSIQSIRGAYAMRGNLNIFAINWRDQADNIYYLKPARYTVQVGRAVAKLIDLLVEEKDADSKRIHLIGHSLGAHIMGYAGSYTKYRVGRVTGLDPARPAFENCSGPEHHLDPSDGDFVDVIHSCGGILGFREPIGFVDFYPNGGGAPQPGCTEISQIFTGCSHGRSYEYFAESIHSDKGFYATPCSSLEEMIARNCTGAKIQMGDPVPMNARGIYYLKTGSKPSYALGLED